MTIDNDFVISLAQLLLIAFAVVVVGFTIVVGIAFGKSQRGAAKTFSFLLQRGNALRLITVVLIVIMVAACVSWQD